MSIGSRACSSTKGVSGYEPLNRDRRERLDTLVTGECRLLPTAAVLWSEGLSRHFNNRRRVAAYAGLAPTPWLKVVRSAKNRVCPSRAIPGCARRLIRWHGCGYVISPLPALTAWFKARRGEKWRSSEEIRNRRACAQTSCGALEVHQRRDRHRRCRYKSLTRVTPHSFQRPAGTDQSW